MFNLQEIYDAIKGRTEFVVKETDQTICFDYVIILDDSFDDLKHGFVRRNIRGITFDKKGNLLSLPFHKFFNINQNEESQFILHKNKKAEIFEKLDGTMIHCFQLDGKLYASTCRSYENKQAIDARNFIENDANLKEMIICSIESGLTPIFEWVGPNNQIVCYYDKPRLVYLMSRSRHDGSYIFENRYIDKANKIELEFKQILDFGNKEGIEGFVCYMEGGTLLKVKTKWYLDRHRSIDYLTRPKYKIYEASLDGYLDDVISLSPEQHKDFFRSIDSEVKHDILVDKLSIEKEYENLSSMAADRKTLAKMAKDSPNFPAIMGLASGKDISEFIKKKLMARYKEKYPEKVMK